ncbi:MAG TPA: OmpA family protein, partial [Geobacteraceae bacterium]|nr:OmpA family protein [Geobacteraceae bacterium]
PEPAPEPKPVPPPPPPAPKPQKICMTLKIEFDYDKYDVKAKYHDVIAKVADFMKEHPETTAVIEGHTDNRGSYKYNIKLSERRADSVRNYMVEKFGIEPDRLTTKGYGYTKPIATNKTAEGRQKNRRVDAQIECIINVENTQ